MEGKLQPKWAEPVFLRHDTYDTEKVEH
jgi:hypothetical protein